MENDAELKTSRGPAVYRCSDPPDDCQSAAADKCDLYFVRMEVAERPIKIGRSVATGKRFKMLQCGSPYALTCLGLLYGECHYESAWHQRFAEQRMFGEWFRPSPELLNAIEAALKEGSRSALGLPEPRDWRSEIGLVASGG